QVIPIVFGSKYSISEGPEGCVVMIYQEHEEHELTNQLKAACAEESVITAKIFPFKHFKWRGCR
ncbi:uncharacterized protein A4U43_C05F7950, partial [Asparagus officinalis]